VIGRRKFGLPSSVVIRATRIFARRCWRRPLSSIELMLCKSTRCSLTDLRRGSRLVPARASGIRETDLPAACTRCLQDPETVCRRFGYLATSRSARCPLLPYRVRSSCLYLSTTAPPALWARKLATGRRATSAVAAEKWPACGTIAFPGPTLQRWAEEIPLEQGERL